jgi:transposase InsO family protein
VALRPHMVEGRFPSLSPRFTSYQERGTTFYRPATISLKHQVYPVWNDGPPHLLCPGSVKLPFQLEGVEGNQLAVLRAEPTVEVGRKPGVPAALVALNMQGKAQLWHARCGHPGPEVIRQLGDMDVGVPCGLPALEKKCGPCVESKTRRVSFAPIKERKATRPFERLHADFMEVNVKSFGGNRYAAVFKCEFSGYSFVVLMHHKSEHVATFEYVLDTIDTLYRHGGVEAVEVHGLHTDNGGEFVGAAFLEFCRKRKILQTFSAPYSPEQNGIAERAIRDIVGKARTLRLHANLEEPMWGELLTTAAYLSNRLPSHHLGGKSPYELVFGDKQGRPEPCAHHWLSCLASTPASSPQEVRIPGAARCSCGI